jgi:hypothetical protein
MNFTPSAVDQLGLLLAQIADLNKQAEAIKKQIKEAGADGLLETDGKVAFVEGALFRATYSEFNSTIFDKEKFIEAHGEALYAKYTKQSASFQVRVKARQ